MEYIVKDGFVILDKPEDFDAAHIFECGQCFRWNPREDGSWVGVAKGRALRISESDDLLHFRCTEEDFINIWREYFDLDRDYAEVRKQVSTDEFMAAATEYGKGIRILRQDPWETLCTFIISQCNNIKRIKGIVERLCDMSGDEYIYEGERHKLFPTPEKLALLDEKDLAPLRAGYRAGYILNAARAVAEGKPDLERLGGLPTAEVVRELCGLKGVGTKVACCTALFGFGKYDAFPVDVWVRRAIERHYGIKNFDSAVFGQFAGFAQQYIFHYIRGYKESQTEIRAR
jgi:N-glycosylase/DNA lyase